MKKISIISLLILSFLTVYSQKEKQIITVVKLEADKIILNNELAFNYARNGNEFSISTKDGIEIIKGIITSHGEGKFSSVITFVKIGKEFSNEKIIGRKELIFTLCENNVIKGNFELDEVKLALFLEKYNELK
jgi:hypothetical protein